MIDTANACSVYACVVRCDTVRVASGWKFIKIPALSAFVDRVSKKRNGREIPEVDGKLLPFELLVRLLYIRNRFVNLTLPSQPSEGSIARESSVSIDQAQSRDRFVPPFSFH